MVYTPPLLEEPCAQTLSGKIPCYEKLRKVSSVKLLPAEAPLLSQPPLNIAANPLKRLSTELDRTGASWLQVCLSGEVSRWSLTRLRVGE